MEVLFDQWGLSRRNNGKRELGVGTRRETLRSRATLDGKDSERLLSSRNETRKNFYATKDFLQLVTERIDLNMYIIGTSA